MAILPDSGSLKAEPGYSLPLDAVFLHGSDYIRADADGAHVRLEVASLIRDKATGALVRFNYTGTIPMAGPAGAVLGDKEGAGSTDFGEICELFST